MIKETVNSGGSGASPQPKAHTITDEQIQSIYAYLETEDDDKLRFAVFDTLKEVSATHTSAERIDALQTHDCAFLDGKILCCSDEHCQYKLTTACFPLGDHFCGKDQVIALLQAGRK